MCMTGAAALRGVAECPVLQLRRVGDPDLLSAALQTRKLPAETLLRLSVHPASEVISMDESPSKALRTKKDSSMRVAINLVRDGRAHAVVSAGDRKSTRLNSSH